MGSVDLRNPPSFLGDPSQVHSAQNDRLTLGALWTPDVSTKPLAAASGALVGPPGTQGELTLISDTQFRVNPGRFIVQGSLSSTQGAYEAINDAQQVVSITGKDASLARRSYIAVTVKDSQAAGVAAAPGNNGGVVQTIDGVLAASNPALPSTGSLPANTLLLGELLIPSVASGQPVQLTPYRPFAVLRGQALPCPTEAYIKALPTAMLYPGFRAFAESTRAHAVWNSLGWSFYDTEWQSHTPVLSVSGVDAGGQQAATRFGRYWRDGKRVTYYGFYRIENGLGYNGQTSVVRMSEPTGFEHQIAPVAMNPIVGTCYLDSPGLATRAGFVLAEYSNPRRPIFVDANNQVIQGGAGIAGWNLRLSIGDSLGWQMTYETS